MGAGKTGGGIVIWDTGFVMQEYELKDSGVEWIGSTPLEWKIKRVKDLISLKSGDGITSLQLSKNGKYPVYGGNGVRGYIDKYTHDGNRLLIGRQGALCGNIHNVDGKFFASEHAVVCTPYYSLNIRWLEDLLRTMNLNQYSNAAAQPGLAVDKIKRLKIPFPSSEEREAIANYLDKACKKIDKTIAIKQQQLEKLEAYRKSVIHEAVTKGLDKNVAMKDSGVEWLGDIPEHWKVNKLKRHATFKNGVNFSASERGAGTITLDVLNMYGGLTSSFDKCYRVNNKNNDDYLLKKGDILFVRSSVKRAGVGWCSMFTDYPEPVQYCGFIIRARLFTNFLDSKFATYFLQSHLGREQIVLRSTTVTITNISQDKLGNIFIPFPSKSEQESITRYLDIACQKFSESKQAIESQIEKLTQYRQSLIHECVTGKKRIYQGDIKQD